MKKRKGLHKFKNTISLCVFIKKENPQGWRNERDEITLPSCHDVRDHAFMHATSHGEGL